MVKLSVDRLKVIKTAIIYICCMASGMATAVIGPTLIDLQHIVQTDTKNIAFVYTARSLGYLFGSLFGGAIFDLVLRKQLIMTIFNFISCISMAAIPWSRKIGVLTPWMALNGAALGAIDTGLNVCLLRLWGKDSGPYYQALHFTYGLGGLIAPLIAAPFLDRTLTSSPSTDYNSTLSLNQTLESTAATVPTVTWVFSIIASILLLSMVLFMFMCLLAPFDDPGGKVGGLSTRRRSRTFVAGVVFLNFLLLFVDTGTEIGYAQMLTTYAVKGPLKLTTTTGSYMTSMFWGAFTLARFFSIFLAIRFSSLSLLIGDLVVLSFGTAFLCFLAPSHEWALWVATAFLGAGIATFYPSCVVWVERYIDVTDKIVGVFAVGAAFGGMLIPLTISNFVEEVPEVVSYVVIATCVLSVVLILVMYSIFRRTKEKYVTDDERTVSTTTTTTYPSSPDVQI